MKQKRILKIFGGGCILLVLACLGAFLFVQWSVQKSTLTVGATDAVQTVRYKLQMRNGFVTKAAELSGACKDDVPSGQYYVFLAFQIEKQANDTKGSFAAIDWQLISPSGAKYEWNDESKFLDCTIGVSSISSDKAIFKPAAWASEDKLVYGVKQNLILQFLVSAKDFDTSNGDWQVVLPLDQRVVVKIPKNQLIPFTSGRDFVEKQQDIYNP